MRSDKKAGTGFFMLQVGMIYDSLSYFSKYLY